MSAQTMKNRKRSGFTLIELLVVVAIIAVIGAGVAVTYNRLDERAKTAMEISDVGTLSKAIAHWSFLHNWALPDGLDALIDTEYRLYSQMPAGSLQNIDDCNGARGLYAQSGYTFKAAEVNDDVADALANGGISLVYLHDATRTPANDSTFTTGTMESDVDTSTTAATVGSDDTDARALAQAQIDARATVAAWDFANDGPYTLTYTDADGNEATVNYASAAAFSQAAVNAETIVAARQTCRKLAFIWSDGSDGSGAQMMGMDMPMNLTKEIISNCGLTPAQVAKPTQTAADAIADGRSYWLIAFGLGRFATIYTGNGARVDTPVCSKRYNDETIYSRYIVVVKVPTDAYDSMNNPSGLRPQVACVLSPQGLSAASLSDSYRNDVKATEN
ncbi:MAG: type II secretion system protein [Kiritimatiellia bacterium]